MCHAFFIRKIRWRANSSLVSALGRFRFMQCCACDMLLFCRWRANSRLGGFRQFSFFFCDLLWFSQQVAREHNLALVQHPRQARQFFFFCKGLVQHPRLLIYSRMAHDSLVCTVLRVLYFRQFSLFNLLHAIACDCWRSPRGPLSSTALLLRLSASPSAQACGRRQEACGRRRWLARPSITALLHYCIAAPWHLSF